MSGSFVHFDRSTLDNIAWRYRVDVKPFPRIVHSATVYIEDGEVIDVEYSDSGFQRVEYFDETADIAVCDCALSTLD